MNIVLIAPPVMDYSVGRDGGELISIGMDALKECPPHGVYLLGAILNNNGHYVDIIDMVAEGSQKIIENHQNEIESTELIGISANSISWPTAVDMIRKLSSNFPNIPIVLGGVHPTMFDLYIMDHLPVHFIIRGEGETPIVELCKAIKGQIPFPAVPNLTWRTYNDNVIQNPMIPQMTPDQIALNPIPLYSELPDEKKKQYKSLAIETSRGCPKNCTFCSTSCRGNYTAISACAFVERLQKLIEFRTNYYGDQQYSITINDTIYIVDNDFTADTCRIKQISNALVTSGNYYPLLIYSAGIASLQEPEVVEALSPITSLLLVGAECGYEDGLKRINKGITREMIETAAGNLMDFGLAPYADFSFIIGLPNETKDQVMTTIDFAAKLHAYYGVRIVLQWYYPVPGSNEWDKLRIKNEVHEAMYDHYGFYRNLHLFQSGNNLKLQHIHDVTEYIRRIKTLCVISHPQSDEIDYTFPIAISENIPDLWKDSNKKSSDLLKYPQPAACNESKEKPKKTKS